MFGLKKPGSQDWRLCISHDSDAHVNVGSVLFNWGRKRTIEDNMHPASDHSQCQHIKVGLVILF